MNLGDVLRQNLQTLAAALPLVEQGELRQALATLENLAGSCRQRAEQWMATMRESLLLRQVGVSRS